MDYWERKRLLPTGAVSAVARAEAVSRAYVSDIVRGNRLGPKTRRIQLALVRKMRKPDGTRVKLDEAFPKAGVA